ncbi:hypothetical protein [Rhizobium giardinii]|uniref:hypothetical protein n=1 Tax=Rhizobium giardinii TaxID=56731 RepID=UPI003D6F2209
MNSTPMLFTVRFICVASVLFITFVIDSGSDYINKRGFIPLLFWAFLMATVLTAWFALIFAYVRAIRIIPNYSLFKTLSISDIIFVHSLIIFILYINYLGSGAENTSIADSGGMLFEKGQFTLRGLHKAVSNIATYTFTAVLLHFVFLLHALLITGRTDSINSRE